MQKQLEDFEDDIADVRLMAQLLVERIAETKDEKLAFFITQMDRMTEALRKDYNRAWLTAESRQDGKALPTAKAA